jgi:hypothetical protein
MSNEIHEEWEVHPVDETSVEINAPDIRYLLEGTDSSETVRVFKNGKQIEESSLRHSGHDWILDASDQEGRKISLFIGGTKERVTTVVTVGGETFSVESAAGEHGMSLMREINKRNYPKPLYIKALVERFRTDSKLRKQVTDRRLAIVAQAGPNGILVACAAVCAVCGLGGVFACFTCLLCIESV